VLAYNGAGNYEQNVIQSISGNTFILRYKVKRAYDIPGGRVQFVRIPFFQSYTASQKHTCMPWNGAKGGVFALNVANTLTLNADIDVSGRGFRGGRSNKGASYACNKPDFYYSFSSNEGGEKGEGIAEVSAARMRGKGGLASGGGGGNNTNAGGAGGGNAGAGGDGGHQWISCDTSLPLGGAGGAALAYAAAQNKIFLGGGGGAGHENNGNTDPGANGGGIVIISAGTLNGGARAIRADGDDCKVIAGAPPGNNGDGESGGGAGGTILLSAGAVTGAPAFSAKGGNGGNIYAASIFGPGGGGGGGAALFTSASLPVPVSGINVTGGSNGVVTTFGNIAHSARPGSSGLSLGGFSYAFPAIADTFSASSVRADFSYVIAGCNTARFTSIVTANAGIASYQWSFGDGNTSGQQHPVNMYPALGTFNVTLIVTDSNGCTDTVTKPVTVTLYTGSHRDTSICEGQTIRLSAFGGTSYSWSPATGLSNPNQASTLATPSVTTTYIVTVSNGAGCSFNDTFTVNVSPPAVADFDFAPSPPAPNAPIRFTNRSANASAFTWDFGDGTGSKEISPAHLFRRSGRFHVCLVANNPAACPDTICKDVDAEVRTGVGVPSAFTPNGDGNNDILFVRGTAVETVNLVIFNRWGQKIFETNSLSIGWDGRWQGRQQEIDLYAYVLRATFIDGTSVVKKGNINLLR
jgi:gliding motility-associated-like protein